MTVTEAKRRKVFERDGFRCVDCGRAPDTGLTIGHRINKGMGGSKLLDGFAYLVTQCWDCNVRETQDAAIAELHRSTGSNLYTWEDPLRVAVFVHYFCEWRLLDAEGTWAPAAGRNPLERLEPEVLAELNSHNAPTTEREARNV